MITYVPEIYPDELIYSWFSRIYVNSGILSSKTAMKAMFQKDSDTANIEFVGNISTDFREQISKMYDWKWLILNHTMFSQYARFILLDKKVESLNILSERHENPRILFPILPKTRDEAYLKYCPLCVKEDRNKYGESYWHRVHQLRSIDICVKHKCFLHKAQILSQKLISYSFQTAEKYTNDDKVIPVTDKIYANYAEYVKNIFESPLNLKKNISLPVLFYKEMKTTKYMKKTGTSRYTDLFVTDIQQFYKEIGINRIASKAQIQRILLFGEPSDFTSVCQMSFFLNLKSEDILNPVLTEEDMAEEKKTHLAADSYKTHLNTNWEELDNALVDKMSKLAEEIYNGSQSPFKLPERVTKPRICKVLGIRNQDFPKLIKCNKVFLKYDETYEESFARKIAWSYNYLKKKREKIYWCDIRKLSCVKKENLMRSVEFLSKYLEKDDIENIKRLAKIRAE